MFFYVVKRYGIYIIRCKRLSGSYIIYIRCSLRQKFRLQLTPNDVCRLPVKSVLLLITAGDTLILKSWLMSNSDSEAST